MTVIKTVLAVLMVATALVSFILWIRVKVLTKRAETEEDKKKLRTATNVSAIVNALVLAFGIAVIIVTVVENSKG